MAKQKNGVNKIADEDASHYYKAFWALLAAFFAYRKNKFADISLKKVLAILANEFEISSESMQDLINNLGLYEKALSKKTTWLAHIKKRTSLVALDNEVAPHISVLQCDRIFNASFINILSEPPTRTVYDKCFSKGLGRYWEFLELISQDAFEYWQEESNQCPQLSSQIAYISPASDTVNSEPILPLEPASDSISNELDFKQASILFTEEDRSLLLEFSIRYLGEDVRDALTVLQCLAAGQSTPIKVDKTA